MSLCRIVFKNYHSKKSFSGDLESSWGHGRRQRRDLRPWGWLGVVGKRVRGHSLPRNGKLSRKSEQAGPERSRSSPIRQVTEWDGPAAKGDEAVKSLGGFGSQPTEVLRGPHTPQVTWILSKSMDFATSHGEAQRIGYKKRLAKNESLGQYFLGLVRNYERKQSWSRNIDQ